MWDAEKGQCSEPKHTRQFEQDFDFARHKASTISAAGCGVPAENCTVFLVYLISGVGNLSENARSNDARSALGKSETAT
jgi:hypothetical protein